MSASKILVISEVFPPQIGGSGRWLWELYRRLPRHEVIIAADQYPGYEQFDLTHQLDVMRLPLKMQQWGLRTRAGLAGYSRLFFQLRRLAKQRRIGCVHAARCLPEGWLAWMLRHVCGLPYLVYVHGEEVEYAASSRELSWIVRRVVAAADYLIANSHNTAAILRRTWSIPEKKIRVLHPGVDTELYQPALRDQEVRNRLGWASRPVVLTVGRLQKRKGHDVMIRALRQIRHVVPDVLYAIAGDGEERAYLEQLAVEEQAMDHVQFLNELNDEQLLQCYQQCDLFVLANRQVGADIEGFGIVLLEAQACGKPVITGASGGTSETMRPGITGLTVPCDGPEQLASAVTDILMDNLRRTRMANAGRKWVTEHFDWQRLAREAELLFQEKRSSYVSPPNDPSRSRGQLLARCPNPVGVAMLGNDSSPPRKP